MHSLITTLSLGKKYSIKFLEPLLARNYALPYARLFMDKIETRFLKAQKFHPLVWFRYINDIFFTWTHGKEELENFMKELKCTFESNKENINFLDVNINLCNGHLMTNMYIKHADCHQYLNYSSSHPNHFKRSI